MNKIVNSLEMVFGQDLSPENAAVIRDDMANAFTACIEYLGGEADNYEHDEQSRDLYSKWCDWFFNIRNALEQKYEKITF